MGALRLFSSVTFHPGFSYGGDQRYKEGVISAIKRFSSGALRRSVSLCSPLLQFLKDILRPSILDIFSDRRKDHQGVIQPLFLVTGPTHCAASHQHKTSGEGLELFQGGKTGHEGCVCHRLFHISVKCAFCRVPAWFDHPSSGAFSNCNYIYINRIGRYS